MVTITHDQNLLTTQPKACSGHVLPSVYFVFSFVGDYSRTFEDDVIISQLQAISQVFLSYPPSGEFCQVSELIILEENGHRRENERNVHLVKIGPKSLGHTRQDICKDKESNLGPVAGY